MKNVRVTHSVSSHEGRMSGGDCGKRPKSVTFRDPECEIHREEEELTRELQAYRTDDRAQRLADRERAARTLAPVLDPGHRRLVWSCLHDREGLRRALKIWRPGESDAPQPGAIQHPNLVVRNFNDRWRRGDFCRDHCNDCEGARQLQLALPQYRRAFDALAQREHSKP